MDACGVCIFMHSSECGLYISAQATLSFLQDGFFQNLKQRLIVMDCVFCVMKKKTRVCRIIAHAYSNFAARFKTYVSHRMN